MIIVEGPDGSGKTSLVRSLQGMTGFPLTTKAVSSEMKANVDLPIYIEAQLAQGFGKRLYDRFALISGPIYGPICGMRPPNDIFTDEVQSFIWQGRLYNRVKPLIIYCLPPPDVVRINVEDPATENSVAAPVWEQAYWSYRMKIDQDTNFYPDRIYRYDYTQDDPHGPYNWLAQKVGSSL